MIRRLNVFLLLLLAGYAVWGYRVLPERIPVHFDLSGTPDGWGSRAMFLVLPAIGAATIILLHFVTRLALRNPRYVNLPDKKRFLELPAQEQHWVLEPMLTSIDWVNTALCVLFIMIEMSMFRAAHGLDTRVMLQVTLVVTILAMTALPLAMLVKTQSRLNEAIRRTGQNIGTVR
jgi:uncharacterized membrane protein